jgi:hypothetical protein
VSASVIHEQFYTKFGITLSKSNPSLYNFPKLAHRPWVSRANTFLSQTLFVMQTFISHFGVYLFLGGGGGTVYPFTYLPTYLPTYRPTHPPTYLPTYLPTYVPT